MSLLELHGLKKTYGPVTALAGVDLSVASGSRTAIVGPSGCGKTTLLRLIAGFETPDSGSIVLDGKPLANGAGAVPAHLRGIGLVAQDGALFPHLSIAENIGFGLGRHAAGRNERITELAYTVGLDSALLKRRPHQLSGGQQQRVALARALAMRPRLILLDEPFSALDTGLRASMRKAVAELLETAGIATVLVTHDQAEALSFADQVAVMREGSFSQVGTPRELYLKPRDRMVAEFLGEALVLPAMIVDGFAETTLGRLPLDGSGERPALARVMLRPEQVMLEIRPATEAADPQAGALYGEVVESEFAGATSTVAVRLINSPDSPEAAAIANTPLVLRKSGIEAPAVGEIVRIRTIGTAHVLAAG